MTVQIGDVIDGKYKIVRLLGEGGMGAVYEGTNTRIHRQVAIKVLHSNVATNDEAMTRFEREAQAAGRIGSDHIVEVLDLGDLPGGERYMVMEFLEGESLSDRIARGQMRPREIAPLMVDMLEGLKAAHGAGIIHRDLKPDNVFLMTTRAGRKDFVKIVDFGISKFSAMGGEFSMTRTGAVMGTPYYMAPEQAKGGNAVDLRADLYAVGVILYQAVVGSVPFDAETFNELLFKIVLESPPPLADRVPGIDPDFVELVDKAMAREPNDRFQTSEEFQNALRAWLGGAYVAAGQTIGAGTPHLGEPGSDAGATAHPTPPEQARGELGTAAPWSHTEGGAGIPMKKSGRSPLWIGLAVLLVGAAGYGFVRVQQENKQADAARQAAEQEQRELAARQADEERAAAMRSLTAEREAAEKARQRADEARQLAEQEKAELLAEKEQTAAPQPRTATPQPAAPRPSSPRPRPQPKPTTAPPPAPKPHSSSTGRTIRTDF